MKAASHKPAEPTASAKSPNPAPERTPAPAPEQAPAPARPTGAGGLTPQSLQRLQGTAGNAAVAHLVAQRYAAPVKPPPSQAPGMRKVNADIAAKKQKLARHRTASAESRSAQGAAKAPPDDRQAQGKAANAEKMNAAQPGEFDKAAFIAAVNEAIDKQAPKNLDEADKFADSGKADEIKGAVDGKVTEGKESSAKDIETTTTAPPDTSQAKEKHVTPMTPDQPPANPGAPNAADAVPRQQPPEVTDFSEGPRQTDQQMADAEVTEEQLAKSNEPQFTEALGEKKKAEQHSATAPAQARTAEKQQLTTAKAGAAAAGATAMAALTAKRGAAGKEVDGGKGETKSKDEQKREEVTAKLQKVFDATQRDVKEILDGLDGKVDRQFEEGEKKARDAFNTDQKRRMKEYKDKRYGGFWGPARWAKDKIAGMPEEANQLFQESRKLYVGLMQGVISSIADMIGKELGRAKARISQGRADLKAEVDKLPADLRQFGQEAAQDFAAKFDDLESEVNDKSQELVQSLAQKYTQALNAVDEEIKKLQEANKGLVQKAVDAVVGVIQTIKELKDLLMGVLAKAASAITKIIKDPIGFLGNLVRSVGAGLQQFMSNIATHLQSGLVSWLLGTSVKAGIEIPSKFDLKGIIQLIASLLGLTWANIKARITRKGVPDQAMAEVEQSVPVAKALATEGPAGATKEIQAEVGDLKSTILEELKSYLIPTVIVAGITWILSLLNPASAFVRAVKGIIDIVTFIVTQGAQIVEFVNAVLDAVIAIAGGGSAGVPKMVETALAASIPLLIGLLASLLGIGSLANKIRQVFQKVSRPVNRAIDKIAAKIAQMGRKLWNRIKPAKNSRRPTKDGKAGNDGKGAGQGQGQGQGRSAAALREATALVRPDSTVEGIEKELPGIKRRHELRVLKLVVDRSDSSGTVIHFKAVNSPAQVSRPQRLNGMSEEEALKKVRAKLPAAAQEYVSTVHTGWWRRYISKVRLGVEEDSPSLWSEGDVSGTEDAAIRHSGTDGFQKPLTAYFTSGQYKSKSFYWYVFTRKESTAKKEFLGHLGAPVPQRLKDRGLARIASASGLDQGYKDGMISKLNALGPDSYNVDTEPYGRLALPSQGEAEHSNFYPENIELNDDGTRRVTTYTTRAGKTFVVTETDPNRSATLKVEGFDLRLKTGGGPRGVTQDSPGFISGEGFNRAHAVADLFGGSGYREARNLVTTSDHYNKIVMRDAERVIANEVVTFAGGRERTGEVSINLTVTISFGELLKDFLEGKIRGHPEFRSGDAEAERELKDMLDDMFDDPVKRVIETKYEWTMTLSSGDSDSGDIVIGSDDWLFIGRRVSSRGN
ncbi:hypothetical protein [Streptomyces sp. NPDC102462]|uniref:hypothetical protein n=1 Tax=Streptomyces sp. NPDC102462 TaxID=3366178 RepID=UPI00380345D9